MGWLDRFRGAEHEEASGQDAVGEYRNALLSAPPAVLGAGHTEAFDALSRQARSELRRRLDARVPAPMGPGDSSPPALAADVTQLRATGTHAVLDLLSAEPTGPASMPLPVRDIATGFLHSHAFRAMNGDLGRRRSVSHERADAEAYAESYLLYVKNLGPMGGPGPTG